MPKTKEEIQKILEKQYLEVQKQEFTVYDKAEEVSKDFTKGVKEIGATLKSELKKHDAKQKEITAKFAVFSQNFIDKDKAHQEEVAKKKVNFTNIYDQSIALAKEKQVAEVKRLEKLVVEIKKANVANLAKAKMEYEKAVEESVKNIKQIIQKGEKDQTSLKGKIEDLKAKFELKITDIDEKHASKLEKLTEIATQNEEKLNNDIKNEREKLDHKLATLKPIYEEELAEIDEKIDDAKTEFDAKYENIKSASDQRIAVREKHMHRAQAENDMRSVKQHKKDIDKFRKEAEKDLVLLTKNFNSANKEAIEYRKVFVKENFEKLAVLDKEHTNIHHKLLHEIEKVKATLKTDLANTNLDFEQQKADELIAFNKGLNDIEHKQAKATKEQEDFVEAEENTQAKLLIEFESYNSIEKEKLDDELESKAKDIRVVNINKDKEDNLAKNSLDIEITKLDNELEVSAVTLEKDQKLNDQQEKIECHELQYNRQTSAKNEFLDYQQLFGPLFVSRAEEIFKYEELEINNRTTIKLATLEKQKARVNKDNELLLAKINEVLAEERVHYDEEITAASGKKLEEFNAFKEEGNLKLESLKEKINALDSKTDRKKIKELNIKLDNETDKLKDAIKQKQEDIKNEIAVFQEALDGAIKRNEIAISEAQALYEAEMGRINQSIDTVTSTKQLELDDAKNKLDKTKEDSQAFVTKAATRNAQTTEENSDYLNKHNQLENDIINHIKNVYATDCEKLNQKLNTLLKDIDNDSQDLLERIDNELKSEEKNYENFKENIAKNIENIMENTKDKLQEQLEKSNNNKKQILDKFDQSNKQADNKLNEKQEEYDKHSSNVKNRIAEEKRKYEDELKQIQKENEENLKQSIVQINSKLSEDIKSIQ